MPLVVTLAPKSAVEDTESEDALVIAALRSSKPVIPMAPSVLVPPMMPLNCTVPVPILKVRLLVSVPSELSVVADPLNVTASLLVVMVNGSFTITPPAAVKVKAPSVEISLPR